MKAWKDWTPIAKIIFFICVIGTLLISLVIYFFIITPDCTEYYSDVIVGKELEDNNNAFPMELVTYFTKFSNEEVCEDCCFYPSKSMKLVRYFYVGQNKQLDSTLQKVDLYNKMLATQSKEYDLPDIDSEINNIKLDEIFYDQKYLDVETFKSKLSDYINRYPKSKILFYTNSLDTLLQYEIDGEIYKIHTNIDDLIEEKFNFISDKRSNSLNSIRFLLVINPILEKKVISITNVDANQRLRDGAKSSEVNFSSSESSPDSIIWQVKESNNIEIAEKKGKNSLPSQKLSLIDKKAQGQVVIAARPYKYGYISSEFYYTVSVTPIPPPLPTIKRFAFNESSYLLTWSEVAGAKSYNLKLEVGNEAIQNIKLTGQEYSLRYEEVEEIFNNNGVFKAKLFASNNITSSSVNDTIFNFNIENLLVKPKVDKDRSKNSNTFKWTRNNPFEFYDLTLSKSNDCDDCILVDLKLLRNNEFVIGPGELPSSVQSDNDKGAHYVYYFRVKSNVFGKSSAWSKDVMFQWVDGKILLCN